MIHHLSFPPGGSVNDFMSIEFSSVKYATVDDAINIIKQLRKGCAMAKTDVRSAFRILPVHLSDYHLLGFQRKGKWYFDRAVPMGAASPHAGISNVSVLHLNGCQAQIRHPTYNTHFE